MYCFDFHAHSGALSDGELWKVRVISCKPKKLDALQKETPPDHEQVIELGTQSGTEVWK